jgi:peroxiredoxin
MKTKLILAAGLLPLSLFAQKPFSLDGQTKNLKTGDKIFLTYRDGGKNVVDSSTVNNGAFKFQGTLGGPLKATLLLNRNPMTYRPAPGEVLDMISFYLEPNATKLVTQDSLSKATFPGSNINADFSKLRALTAAVDQKMRKIENDYTQLSPEDKKSKQDDIMKLYGEEQKKLVKLQLDFVKSNTNSFVSLDLLNGMTMDAALTGEIESGFTGLNQELKVSKTGKELSEILSTMKKTSVGMMAMDFIQNDPDGKPVKLSDFKGKYVLLDFWASWCGPCRAENPNVVKAYNTFKDKNFTVLGVSLDQPGKKEAWQNAIKQDGLTWTQVSDLKFWNNEAAKLYGIKGIPANFLIDPTGKIVARDVRGDDLTIKLTELLK